MVVGFNRGKDGLRGPVEKHGVMVGMLLVGIDELDVHDKSPSEIVMELKKCCNHPWLVEDAKDYDEVRRRDAQLPTCPLCLFLKPAAGTKAGF